jgi:hypothetical protein
MPVDWWDVGVGVLGVGIGAAAAHDASRKASHTAADSVEDAGRITQGAAAQARQDVNRLYPQAREDLMTGASGAFDIFNQALGGQQQALQQGNLNAQTTLGQGFNQQQNALLGLPVDQGVFAPKTLGAAPTAGQGAPLGGAAPAGNPLAFQAGGFGNPFTGESSAQTPEEEVEYRMAAWMEDNARKWGEDSEYLKFIANPQGDMYKTVLARLQSDVAKGIDTVLEDGSILRRNKGIFDLNKPVSPEVAQAAQTAQAVEDIERTHNVLSLGGMVTVQN